MTQKPKAIALEIKDLVKTYQGRKAPAKEALKSVNLTVPQGMIYGLLGPNGAGKSTLINILAGLTVKTSGKVLINGIDQDENARLSRYQLGVVPQEVILDPFFTVRETLDYYAGYYGVPKKERRTDEIMEALHLTDKQNTNSRRLSGGMKRRVLIAKALVHNPSVLILDEPTAGVDVDLRFQLWEYVRKLNKLGTTILLTTHYLEEAEELCDRIAIINHGRIVAEDTTRSLVKKLDEKQLTLTLEKKITSVPASLKKYDAKLIGEHEVTIRYQRSKSSINDILHTVCSANLSVADITTSEPDLEDAFRLLIGQHSEEMKRA
jgi:ABC-2 type transport system ATP-binding protein